MNSTKLLCLMMVFLFASVCLAQEVFESVEGTFSTRKLSDKKEMNGTNKLLIRAAANLPGEITVNTSKAKEVTINYYKKAKSDDRKKGIDFIDLIAVVLDKTPDGIRLEMRAPNPAPWSGNYEWGMIEARITVPENCYIDINAAQFDVTADGPFRAVVISKSLGRIEVSNVLEKLDVATSNRRVNVNDISGDISISTTNAVLNARNLVSVGSRSHLENEHGDIRVDGFTGEIEIENSYGRIHLGAFNARGKRNVIRGMSGPISLEIIQLNDAQLRVTNRFDDVEINLPGSASAALSLAVDEGGKIEVSNFNVKPELIAQNRMNLVAGKGSSIISSNVRGSGNIYIRGNND